MHAENDPAEPKSRAKSMGSRQKSSGYLGRVSHPVVGIPRITGRVDPGSIGYDLGVAMQLYIFHFEIGLLKQMLVTDNKKEKPWT